MFMSELRTWEMGEESELVEARQGSSGRAQQSRFLLSSLSSLLLAFFFLLLFSSLPFLPYFSKVDSTHLLHSLGVS